MGREILYDDLVIRVTANTQDRTVEKMCGSNDFKFRAPFSRSPAVVLHRSRYSHSVFLLWTSSVYMVVSLDLFWTLHMAMLQQSAHQVVACISF